MPLMTLFILDGQFNVEIQPNENDVHGSGVSNKPRTNLLEI
jgi:hypothetical protein